MRGLRPVRRVCHGDIGMPQVVEILKRETATVPTRRSRI